MSDPPGPTSASRRTLEAVWAAVVLALGTLLATYPVAALLRHGMADPWDGKLVAWILHWDFHQTFRDPARLFDANIFSPARYALAFSENLFGAAVFGFPLYAAGASTLTVSNVLLLLGMFLSALAAWALARELTGDAVASLLAGFVYAFGPWRISQIAHLQFQWGAFLPLLLLYFVRYLRTGAARDRTLFAVCLAWNALCNVHYALFSGFLLLAAGLWAWLPGEEVMRARLARLLPAAAAAAVLVAVFFVPYVRASRLYGFHRSTAEVETYSGRPRDFLSAGARNHLYGAVTKRFAMPEGDFFPGFVPYALALAALFVTRREGLTDPSGGSPPDSGRAGGGVRGALDVLMLIFLSLWVLASIRSGLRLGPLRLGDPGRLLVFATAALFLRLTIAFPRASRYRNLGDFLARGRAEPRIVLCAAVAATGVVVALGLHTPYYRFLFDSFGPVFRGIRAPARGVVLFHLGLAVLAAEGLSRLSRRVAGPARRGILVAAVLAAVGLEYRAWPIEIHPIPDPPAVYEWLAQPSVAASVMEWPLGFPFDFEYEFQSTVHWKPIVNGASGFAPPLYEALWADLRKTSIPEGVWDRIRDVGASVLVFHPHDAPIGLLKATRALARRGVAEGRLEPLAFFPHGPDTDYVFRISSGAAFEGGTDAARRREAAQRFAVSTLRPAADPSPPLVFLDFPPAGVEVVPGAWAYGWVADDSGIAGGTVLTETGENVPVTFRGERPEVAKLLLGFANSQHPGFHFMIPRLAPGKHELVVTVEGVDGGTTVLKRRIRVR